MNSYYKKALKENELNNKKFNLNDSHTKSLNNIHLQEEKTNVYKIKKLSDISENTDYINEIYGLKDIKEFNYVPDAYYQFNQKGKTMNDTMLSNLQSENNTSNEFNILLQENESSDTIDTIKQNESDYATNLQLILNESKKRVSKFDKTTTINEIKLEEDLTKDKLKNLKKVIPKPIIKKIALASIPLASVPLASIPLSSAASASAASASISDDYAIENLYIKPDDVDTVENPQNVKKTKNVKKTENEEETKNVEETENVEEIREDSLKSNNKDNNDNDNDNDSVNTDETDDLQQTSSDGILKIINMCKNKPNILNINNNQRIQINNMCRKYNIDIIDSRMKLKTTIIKKFKNYKINVKK